MRLSIFELSHQAWDYLLFVARPRDRAGTLGSGSAAGRGGLHHRFSTASFACAFCRSTI